MRIEDTDQNRFVPGAENYIIESLRWCGLIPDEGAGFGGDLGPYRQSERRDIYMAYVERLVESGHAYYAFDTPEELEALRAEAEAARKVFSYDTHTRMRLNNSLSLSEKDVKRRIETGQPWVIRFKMPENSDVTEPDLIRGEVIFNTSRLDDKVLFKTDGMPTYHLANVVDDHLMRISHVIRGEEWLSSMPLHILLYEALGWADSRPRFAHLPLILKPVGKGKLSKRDGDKMGFPVFPLQWTDPHSGEVSRGYREEGYLPEAFVNMLALLGWHGETDQELFAIDELVERFSLERVVKSGARFDPEKARWFNRNYLHRMPDAELAGLFFEQLAGKGIAADRNRLERITGLIKDRCTFAADLWEHGFYFFEAPEDYDEKIVRKKWKTDTSEKLTSIAGFLEGIDCWEAGRIKEVFSVFMNSREWSFGMVMVPVRLALVGSSQGIDLFLIMEMIGKAETLNRIRKAVSVIAK